MDNRLLDLSDASSCEEPLSEPTEQVVDPFQAIAEKRAHKILKKNSREIERLKQHAEKCLYELNRDGYIYAIGKLRKIIRKPLNDEALGALYDTSVERIVEMFKDFKVENKEG